MKLSLLGSVGFSVVLAIGAGACVADADGTNEMRVETDDVAVLDANEVELPREAPDHIEPAIVVITGVDWPGRAPTQPNIDVTNLDTLTLNPEGRAICALVEQLPHSDACSTLCDPSTYVARVFAEGGTGCTQQTCVIPGGPSLSVDVCD